MNKASSIVVGFLSIIAVLLILWFSITPAGRATWNNWFFSIQKADDATNYKTIKKVEDTCRAMMASYEADKLTYEQYKDNKDSEKQGWAEQAKMRANKTAAVYNSYILKNSFVWEQNIPRDIRNNLDVIK